MYPEILNVFNFTISLILIFFIDFLNPRVQARVVTKGQKKILCSYLGPVLVMAVILNIPKMVSLAELLFSQVNTPLSLVQSRQGCALIG